MNRILGVNQSLVSGTVATDNTISDEETHRVMSNGPACLIKGKAVPCFYGASPNASINSEMLAEMLKHNDALIQFDRSIATPFLLLDGHQSRLMTPFLKHVYDEATRWTAAIGVPYATHAWQVADPSEPNGAFKMSLARAKRECIVKTR